MVGGPGVSLVETRIKATLTAPESPFTPAHFLNGSADLAPSPLATIHTCRHTLLQREPMVIITHERSAGFRGSFLTVSTHQCLSEAICSWLLRFCSSLGLLWFCSALTGGQEKMERHPVATSHTR